MSVKSVRAPVGEQCPMRFFACVTVKTRIGTLDYARMGERGVMVTVMTQSRANEQLDKNKKATAKFNKRIFLSKHF